MPGNKDDHFLRSYSFLLLWFAIISAGSIWLYFEIAKLLSTAVLTAGLQWPTAVADAISNSWLIYPLLVLGGILFWWRVVKVAVLHGVPFKVGMKTAVGNTAKNTDNGRVTLSSWIGSMENAYADAYDGCFWFGTVFKSHPASDKLMRTRLELLIVALSPTCSFLVNGSQWSLRRDSHHQRARSWRYWMDRYSKTRPAVSDDSFKRDVVAHLRTLANGSEKAARRVDGLSWFLFDGQGTVTDDFGGQVTFARQGEQFLVQGLGPKGDQEKAVATIAELRDLAKADLIPLE